jgi:putative transposase
MGVRRPLTVFRFMTANQAEFPIATMCIAFGVSRSGYYPRGAIADHRLERRLMRQAGLAGVSRRRGPRTTIRDARLRPASDLVDRNVLAEKPDVLWVADITPGRAGGRLYVPNWAGFLYLAVVLDAFSRRIVGWAMGTDLKTDLVLDALNMAAQQRRPGNVIHHWDQGSQLGFKRSSRKPDTRPETPSRKRTRRHKRA